MISETFQQIVTPELAQGAIINNRHPGFKEDYQVIHCLMRKYKPATLFEIGTNTGFGTKIIKNAIGEGTVFSMDLPVDEFRKLQSYPDRPGLECDVPYVQLYGDSLTFKFERYPAEAYFVDGAHDYKHVFREATEIIKLSPRLIIFHDADIPEVALAIADAFDLTGQHYATIRVTGTRIVYAVRLTTK